jgi:signal transduction histidine kinase
MAQIVHQPHHDELQRLIRELQHQVETGVVPEVLRSLTDELEKHTRAEMRLSELSHNEQLARAEVRELREANLAKDHILAVLSHELRTPLQPVLSSASALLRDPRMPPDLLEDVRTIQRNVQLEARLIDDLLDVTRIVNGKLALEKSIINIDSVIARAVEICEPDVIQKRQTLSLKLQAQRRWVHGDPGRLQQVLWNLIKNAVKFTPSGGSVEIATADEAGGQLIVRVIDTGVGIEADAIARIFNAFEQGSPAVTQRYGGLGLGLAICKVLGEAHGGTLTAHSDGPGRGAVFTLTLPTADPPQEATSRSRAVRSAVPVAPMRILLVEDDHDTAKVLTMLLESIGHEVTTAHDCATGLAALDEAAFDLLISDLGLPDGSGHELMTRHKSKGIKAIALTGYGSEADIQASLAAGFDCHLTKPVTLDQLVQAMRRL